MTLLFFNFLVALLFCALATAVGATVFRNRRGAPRLDRGQISVLLLVTWVLGSGWNYFLAQHVLGPDGVGWIPYLAPFFMVCGITYGAILVSNARLRRYRRPQEDRDPEILEGEFLRSAGIIVGSYLVVLLIAVLAVLIGRAVLGGTA